MCTQIEIHTCTFPHKPQALKAPRAILCDEIARRRGPILSAAQAHLPIGLGQEQFKAAALEGVMPVLAEETDRLPPELARIHNSEPQLPN